MSTGRGCRGTPLHAGVASIFRSAVQAGAAPRVFEDGGQRRDFVHVEDVAHANVLALTATGPVEGAVNIASGRPHTLWDMATALHDAAGSTAAPVVTGDYRLGDVRHITASPRRAREMLGFVARVGLNEGMARFAVDPMRVSPP